MQASLERLLQSAVDYEGLLIPSQAEVARALQEWLHLARSPQGWALGGLVCPVDGLAGLAAVLARQPEATSVRVVVAMEPTRDRGEWEDALERAASEMNAFVGHADGRAEIEAFNARPPDHPGLESALRDLRGFSETEVYVELPWGEGMEDSLALLAESEWAFAAARDEEGAPLLGFLHSCVSLDLPFRLSVGARDPLPLLTATALAVSADLSRREIEALPAEDEPPVLFDREGLVWRGHRASMEAIEAARELLLAVGSQAPQRALDALVRKVR